MNKLISLILCIYLPSAFCWGFSFAHKDKLASKLMQQQDYQHAYETFERRDWKATAAYKAGNYKIAAHLFAELNTADGYYNQGNALAKLGDYQSAINAYELALKLDPKHEDAKYNLDLLKKMQNKQQESKPNKSDQNKPGQQKKSDKPSTKNNQSQEKSQQKQSSNRDEKEKHQAKDQWLSLIPDDPGAFLREKFLRDYLRSQSSNT